LVGDANRSARMNFEIQHELGILTNDGWVITLLTDKEITLGDAIIKSIIVQPKEDWVKRVASDLDTSRHLYRVNTQGEIVYEKV
jgi:hypothetical protein